MERELAEEMEGHVEMMPFDRRVHFGNPTLLREQSREEWSWIWLQQLWQDLSYGLRVLRNAPAFTLGATAVLAIGVGVNLAEFQIFDRLIFHRWNIRDADSLIELSRVSKQGQTLGFAPAVIEFYREYGNSFEWLVSEDTSIEVTLDADVDLRSSLVSADYFTSLGAIPSWDRLFDLRDSRPGSPAVAVLGYKYWQNHLAGDARAVGRVVHINGQPVQIVGVLPYSVDGISLRQTAVWLPLSARPLISPGSLPPAQDFSHPNQESYGKLKPGISRAAAEAELTSLTRVLFRHQPAGQSQSVGSDDRIRTRLVQESMATTAARAPGIAVLVVMILLVLVSACANLGNILLARGLARQREIGIRMAIGASRLRLVRQLMTENVLLGILGSFAGVLMRALDAPPSFQLSTSWPIFLAGLLLTLFSTLVFGLPSALQTVGSKHQKSRLRQVLVGVQVAVSCFLLIAAAVLAHSGIINSSLDIAFDYKNMAVIDPQLYLHNLPAAVALQKLDELTTTMSALPGVDGVTLAVGPPLGARRMIERLPGLPHIYWNSVAASYFSVMKLAIIRGRAFSPGEKTAVMISESASRAIWPNQDPIGKTLNLKSVDRVVSGVVKDSGANLLADPESVEVYLPIQGVDIERSVLILHFRGDAGVLRHLIPTAAGPSHEALSVSLMRSSRENYLRGMKMLVTLLGVIGAIATVLAAAGMFALVAYAVAQRKRELGIRIAIGARSRHILWILLTQNARPTALGPLAGALLALILSRLVRSFIYLQHGESVDVAGFIGGLACFTLVAALATLTPAIRALSINPSETLRDE